MNRAIYDEDSGEMIEIMAGDFLVVYAPETSENYESLPPELNRKYAEKFHDPQRFCRMNGEIIAIPYQPKRDSYPDGTQSLCCSGLFLCRSEKIPCQSIHLCGVAESIG